MNFAKSSGVPPPTSAPNSVMGFFISAVLRMALVSALMRSMISRGVPAGAMRPYHDDAYTPLMPSSSNVGTLGNAGLRAFDATASALILPAAMKGRQVVV